MPTLITVVRYPRRLGFFGLLSMALFRFPLLFRKDIPFSKLMGSGKGGSFSKVPDWNQWAVLAVVTSDISERSTHTTLLQYVYGTFICGWWQLFRCTIHTYVLEAIEGHGLWDGKACFGPHPRSSDYEGRIAILTRATIRLNRLNQFWSHVEAASEGMLDAPGYEWSIGIGEVPWVKQATFSIWSSKSAMKDYAYRNTAHTDVIGKTRAENWYREEMFVRFRILAEYTGD